MKKITIGRSNENDICFEESQTVSSFHAEIVIDEAGEVTYVDHSTNGSTVNGQKVHNSSCIIRKGDKIILPVDVEVEWESSVFQEQKTLQMYNGPKATVRDVNQIQAQVQPQSQPQPQPQPQQVYAQPQPQPQQVYAQPQPQPQPQPQQAYAQPQQVYQAYREQLPTKRGLLKYILLGLITFSIYQIVVLSKISSEINTVARQDRRHTLHYLLMLLLTPLTLGIFTLIWFHNLSDRIGNELKRRNIPYSFGASSFWLWNVLGSLIVVGPYIYIHKLLHAMNMINGSYNQYGE